METLWAGRILTPKCPVAAQCYRPGLRWNWMAGDLSPGTADPAETRLVRLWPIETCFNLVDKCHIRFSDASIC